MFAFLRNNLTVFHRGYTILYSHRRCTKFPVSPPLCQHLLFICFDYGHFTICELVSYCGFYFISLMISDYLFMSSLVFCISLEKCSSPLPNFELFLFVCLLLSFRSSSFILDTNSSSDTWFTDVSSSSVDYLFTFLIVPIDVQKFLIFMNFPSIFFFYCLCF